MTDPGLQLRQRFTHQGDHVRQRLRGPPMHTKDHRRIRPFLSNDIQRTPPTPGIANDRPLCPLPTPIVDPDKTGRLDIRRYDRLGGIVHEYQRAA
jgi:hypothetical protein